MNGWWIFAGTAAVSILSKHVITWRGHHFFNPSNFGLVLCFVLLGATRADPLAFWWGPMSPWLALALVIILVGAFAILSRLHLLAIAVTFWVAFAIGIAVIAAAGHQMTARWHLGPITGFEFWRVVVLSPEVMIFLFFMITDPKTTPKSRIGPPRLRARGRAARGAADRAAGDGVLDEGRPARGALDRLRGAAARRCAGAAPAGLRSRGRAATGSVPPRSPARPCSPACSCSPASPRAPRRPSPGAAAPVGTLPQLTVLPSKGVATQIGTTLAQQIAGDLVADLRIESDALRTRDKARAATAAGGTRLQGLWAQIDAAGTSAIIVPERHVDKLQLELETAVGQEPPIVVATATGTERLVTFHGTPAAVAFRATTTPFTRTLELQLDGGALPDRRLARRHARGGCTRLVGAARLVRRRRRADSRTSPRRSGSTSEQNAFRTHGDDGRDRDDGRRRLLDRHRQRRLARPLRRQLVRGRRPRLLAGSTAACPAAPSSTTSRGGSPTSAARPAPTSSSAATAASPATSTATASPTSTSPLPATTPCSGTTARATSPRAPAPPGSPPGAGTRAPPSAT